MQVWFQFYRMEFEKSGTYSVKSGYHLALSIAHAQSASSSSASDGSSIPTRVWKRLWSLSIPSRILFFVWRLLHNACPTNSALFQRNSCLSPVCLRCGEHIETSSHLFLHCPTSIRLWRASRLGFNFETGVPIPLSKWLQQWITDAPEDEDLILSIYILWNIWLVRNKFIWEGVHSSPEQILYAAQRMNQKGLPWQEDNQLQQAPYFSACKKPVTIRILELFFHGLQLNQHNCQMVLTIDGSFQATSQICKAAIAWVVEDRIGNLISQHSSRVHALTALQTEALACLWALKHLCTVSCHSVLIKTDSLLLLHALANPDNCPPHVRSISEDIVYTSQFFSVVQVVKVERALVVKAHVLACETRAL